MISVLARDISYKLWYLSLAYDIFTNTNHDIYPKLLISYHLHYLTYLDLISHSLVRFADCRVHRLSTECLKTLITFAKSHQFLSGSLLLTCFTSWFWQAKQEMRRAYNFKRFSYHLTKQPPQIRKIVIGSQAMTCTSWAFFCALPKAC